MEGSSRRRDSPRLFAIASISSSISRASRAAVWRQGWNVEFGLPIRAGDSITIESQLRETYEKTGRTGTMVFIVFRSTLKNQHREVVAHIDYRFMRRPDTRARG